MSTLDLDAIRRRAEAATPGPWWAWNRCVGWHIALGTAADDVDEVGRPLRLLPEGIRTDIDREPDAQFIAHARADVPALLAEVERLRAALERVRALHSPEPGWERNWRDPHDALAKGWPDCAGCRIEGVAYREIGECPTLAALAAVSTPDGTRTDG